MTSDAVRTMVLGCGLALYTAVGVVCLLLAVRGVGLDIGNVISVLAAAYAATRISCMLWAPMAIDGADGVLS